MKCCFVAIGNNVYINNINELDDSKIVCFSAIDEQTNLWHWRARYLNLKLLKYLESYQFVKGLPKISNKAPSSGTPCQQGKQKQVSHKIKNQVSTTHRLQLFHMDLVGPMQAKSLGGKKY